MGQINPNCIGVKYSLIEWGGKLNHVSVLTYLLVKSWFFFILNWNLRYLSKLRQYKAGMYVILKQCYYGANIILRCIDQLALPQIQLGLVECHWAGADIKVPTLPVHCITGGPGPLWFRHNRDTPGPCHLRPRNFAIYETINSSEMIAAGKEFSFVYKTLSVMYRDRHYLGFDGLNQVQKLDNIQQSVCSRIA